MVPPPVSVTDCPMVGGNKEAAALAKSMATVFMNQAFELIILTT
jgi:hypothetical protein